MRPCSVLLYGPPKTCKTTIALQALDPKLSYWFCFDIGGIKPAMSPELNPWVKQYGSIKAALPRYGEFTDPTKPFDEVTQQVDTVCKEARAGKVGFVVIDTISAFASRIHDKLMGPYATKDNYGAASTLAGRQVRSVVDRTLNSGAFIVCIAHEQPPNEMANRPGGPQLPGKMVEGITAQFDVVLRCQIVNGAPVFLCNPLERTYITANRYHCSPAMEPADLRGLMQRCYQREQQAQL